MRGAKWRAGSEMGAGGQPTPDGARPRARRRGQPREREVASDGWEARAGIFTPALGFPAGRRRVLLNPGAALPLFGLCLCLCALLSPALLAVGWFTAARARSGHSLVVGCGEA